MNLLKTLSTTYLQTAKKLDDKWLDLVRKSTRDNVINDVLKYENIHKDAIRKFKIRQKQDKIIREHHKIIKKYKKMMKEQSNKQTADVLLFKRYTKNEIIPEGKKIAFKDHLGVRYILKIRRYFIIDQLTELETELIVGNRFYDYYDNNGKRDDFDKVVKLLKTSEDFNELQDNHKD